MKFDFGLVGLGVMGRNFILNVAENGFSSIGLSSSEKKIKLLKEEGKDFDIDGTKSDKVFIDILRHNVKADFFSVCNTNKCLIKLFEHSSDNTRYFFQ